MGSSQMHFNHHGLGDSHRLRVSKPQINEHQITNQKRKQPMELTNELLEDFSFPGPSRALVHVSHFLRMLCLFVLSSSINERIPYLLTLIRFSGRSPTELSHLVSSILNVGLSFQNVYFLRVAQYL